MKTLSLLLLAGLLAGGAAQAADIRLPEAEFAAGEWQKTVPGVPLSPNDRLVVLVRSADMLCAGAPITLDHFKTALQNAATAGTLQAKLAALEGHNGSAQGLVDAFSALELFPITSLRAYPAGTRVEMKRRTYAEWNAAWSGGQPVQLGTENTVDSRLARCWALAEAQAFAAQLAGIIRAHLGLAPRQAVQGMNPR
jgi:hypothetical protein